MKPLTAEDYNNIRNMSMSEHQIQKAYFQILSFNESEFPFLKYIFAIPNGGHRHVIVAKKMKAEGVKRGVPDIFVPYTDATKKGLFLETKTHKGVQSEHQKEYAEYLQRQGYHYKLCRSVDELINASEEYLNIRLQQ